MNEESKATEKKTASGMSPFAYGSVFVMGVYLGILFAKSEIARWERVHHMFLFKEAQMYLIIALAIGISMISMFAIRTLGVTTVSGKPIKYEPKPFHKGVVIGGALFGAGWAITGACPGPIYTQIGGGEWMAVFTLAGAMLGMFTYAVLKPKLPH